MEIGAHTHELSGSWSQWLGQPALRVILAALAATGLVTIVGVVVWWPDGSGQRDATATAAEVGLASERFAGTVDSVSDDTCSYSSPELEQVCRTVVVTPEGGSRAGEPVLLSEFNLSIETYVPDFEVGSSIVLGYEESTDTYFYADQDRRSTLWWLAGLFALVVVAFGRLRGVLALGSMAFTVAVLIGWLAPTVLDGTDPLLASMIAASLIAFVGLAMTHGATPTTTVAIAGTVGALLITLVVSVLFFDALAFTGLATEEGLALPIVAGELDLSRLLLGGAMIGALGALDDVTVTQVAAVGELARTDPSLPVSRLVGAGIRVGRAHIASTVNTLLLAYVGASMPLLLLFAVSSQPLEFVANSELIAVEIARTLCGSIGLVAAVPITTALAAAVVVHHGDDTDGADPPNSARLDEAADPPTWESFGPDTEPDF